MMFFFSSRISAPLYAIIGPLNSLSCIIGYMPEGLRAETMTKGIFLSCKVWIAFFVSGVTLCCELSSVPSMSLNIILHSFMSGVLYTYFYVYERGLHVCIYD